MAKSRLNPKKCIQIVLATNMRANWDLTFFGRRYVHRFSCMQRLRFPHDAYIYARESIFLFLQSPLSLSLFLSFSLSLYVSISVSVSVCFSICLSLSLSLFPSSLSHTRLSRIHCQPLPVVCTTLSLRAEQTNCRHSLQIPACFQFCPSRVQTVQFHTAELQRRHLVHAHPRTQGRNRQLKKTPWTHKQTYKTNERY